MESMFKPKRTGTIFMFADIDGASKETGYYTSVVDEESLFNDLIAIKNRKEKIWKDFYYKDYLGIAARSWFTSEYTMESTPEKDIPYFSKNAQGEKKELLFTVKLNKKIGDLETGLSGSIKVNLDNTSSIFVIHANYADYVETTSDDEKVLIGSFDPETMVTSNEKRKVVAIEIVTNDYESYNLLMSDLFPGFNMEEYIVAIYNSKYKQIGDRDLKRLHNFYSQVPPIFLSSLTDQKKFQDFKKLLEYDADNGFYGWFTDSTSAMLKILLGFNDLSFLYKSLKNEPAFVISIYKHLDTDEDTELYCNFLMLLGMLYETVEGGTALPVVYHGEGYSIDSDLFLGDSEKVRIKNLQKYTKETPYIEKAGKDELQFAHNDTTSYSIIISDYSFHPLAQIRFVDTHTGEETIVPAIFIKRLSDIIEWETITDVLMLALNILSIFLSAGILVKGAVGFYKILAVSDIAISATNIAMSNDEIEKMLRESGPAGVWFADNWAAISMISGLGIISIAFAKKIIEKAPQLLNKLSNSQLKARINQLYEVSKKMMTQGDDMLKIFDKRYLQLYVRPKSLYNLLTRSEIRRLYGKVGVRLYTKVEARVKQLRFELKTGNKRSESVLVAGMADKETGIVSKLFTNFTTDEVLAGLHKLFLDDLHPNLVKRLEEHLRRRALGLNLKDPDVIKYGWRNLAEGEIIPHAEFRALDDILKTISKYELPESVFDRIIGYNSFLKKDGIQATCADCFYLTDLVTFIK